jgi:hypothetical protein
LDEVADSEGASWSRYSGPVWIDFEVRTRFARRGKEQGWPTEPQDISTLDDASDVRIGSPTVSQPDCDHVADMEDRIMQKAFPHLHEALGAPEGHNSGEEVRAAVLAELRRVVQAEWRRAARNKRTDRIGEIARVAGAPVRQIENVLRGAERRPQVSRSLSTRAPRANGRTTKKPR